MHGPAPGRIIAIGGHLAALRIGPRVFRIAPIAVWPLVLIVAQAIPACPASPGWLQRIAQARRNQINKTPAITFLLRGVERPERPVVFTHVAIDIESTCFF